MAFDRYASYLYTAYGITLGVLFMTLCIVVVLWRRAKRLPF